MQGSQPRPNDGRRRPVLRTQYLVAFLFVVALLGKLNIAPAEQPWVTEPIFGLYYDPREVHFATVPTADLLPNCKRMLLEYEPLPKSLTLYARYEAGPSRIYIAGARDILGVYVIRNGVCDSDVPILALLQKKHVPPAGGDAPLLSSEGIASVFSNALTQYTNAFGDKAKFFTWLDSLSEKMRAGCKNQSELSCPPTYHSLLPEQQRQLEEYRKK